MRRIFSACVAILIASSAEAAEIGLTRCAAEFPGGSIDNAPTRIGSSPSEPAAGNIHVCERSGDTPFFALEYNPSRLIPDWVAYRLENHFGAAKCGSRPRDHMQCYFKSDDVGSCIESGEESGRWPGDPFHIEKSLEDIDTSFLKTNAFVNTKHDRGHMAPNNAFSWHMCGTYKTFTMANMAPQHRNFNREVWRKLEEAVLFWATEIGPIYVVTGPIYAPFPADRFRSYDKRRAVNAGETLRRDGARGRFPRIINPTGFFKVIFRPEANSAGRSIAFLLPHSSEKGLDFRDFATTVSLVEQQSGLEFGLDQSLKNGGGENFWLENLPPPGWSVRPSKADLENACPDGLQAQGWFTQLPKKARVTLCATTDFAPPN